MTNKISIEVTDTEIKLTVNKEWAKEVGQLKFKDILIHELGHVDAFVDPSYANHIGQAFEKMFGNPFKGE